MPRLVSLAVLACAAGVGSAQSATAWLTSTLTGTSLSGLGGGYNWTVAFAVDATQVSLSTGSLKRLGSYAGWYSVPDAGCASGVRLAQLFTQGSYCSSTGALRTSTAVFRCSPNATTWVDGGAVAEGPTCVYSIPVYVNCVGSGYTSASLCAPATPSGTRSSTATQSATHTRSGSHTATQTKSNTPTRSRTPSYTPTASGTSSNDPTRSRTPSRTPTASRTPSTSPTGSRTPSHSPTASVTPSNSPTPSVTPTNTMTPTMTATSTMTPSMTATSSATYTPTGTYQPNQAAVWEAAGDPFSAVQPGSGDTFTLVPFVNVTRVAAAGGARAGLGSYAGWTHVPDAGCPSTIRLAQSYTGGAPCVSGGSVSSSVTFFCSPDGVSTYLDPASITETPAQCRFYMALRLPCPVGAGDAFFCASQSATASVTASPSRTPTTTGTPSRTPSKSGTATKTSTNSGSRTASHTHSRTGTPSATGSPTGTAYGRFYPVAEPPNSQAVVFGVAMAAWPLAIVVGIAALAYQRHRMLQRQRGQLAPAAAPASSASSQGV